MTEQITSPGLTPENIPAKAEGYTSNVFRTLSTVNRKVISFIDQDFSRVEHFVKNGVGFFLGQEDKSDAPQP